MTASPDMPPMHDQAPRGPRLGIIYNTQSGRHRRRWGRHPVPDDVLAAEANTPAEIGAAVARLGAEEVDVLAVAGGDGTVQCVLGELLLAKHFKRRPQVALVPTGSTNMTAHDVGFADVRRHGWQPLRDWVEGRAPHGSARVRERSVLRIQASDTAPAFCGMFFGAGAIHHAVQYTQQQLHRVGLRGEAGPSVAFARFLKSIITGDTRHFAPIGLRLRDEQGHTIHDETLILVASTLERLVLGFRPFWGGEAAPIAWTAISRRAPRFLFRLLRIARGARRWAKTAPPPGYVSHNSYELTLDFDGGFIVDGEFHRSNPADGPVRLSVAGRVPFVSI